MPREMSEYEKIKDMKISQVKMFNPNLYKNKSYDMNFIHKNMSYMPL